MEPSEIITNPQKHATLSSKYPTPKCPTGKPRGRKKPPGGPNNYQSSEPTADACLKEQRREMRALTGRTTSMN